MTNFEFLKARIKTPVSRTEFILSRCRGKKVLDLGCVQHSFEMATKNPNWLHKKLYNVAQYVLGIDYLKQDIKKLKELGFNIIYGDVTNPIHLDEKFDIIIAGNLIEHLANFEGFFSNLKTWLSPSGEVLISTPNPFYIDQYFYIAFKKSIFISPEHICWLDPVALNQLAERFGFKTTEIRFIDCSWKLGSLILESENQYYDILNDKWVMSGSLRIGIIRRFFRKSLTLLYFIICKIFSRCDLYKYSDIEQADILERFVVEKSFQLFWNFYKLFIVKSDLNKYEDYISVLKLD